ncbi:GNAT family N-acetyltransferase [Lysobacter sp. FW306-1B-D06B]|uniref:GNAT family N-acetyltransferase n=1 Tax=Lysobacter sp. FW306-1B-D06B TaxID=3140250 RepID=UPI00314069E7
MDVKPLDTARPLDVRCYNGAAIEPWLGHLAALRIAVFRDWPYLYDGDEDYEAQYLKIYLQSPRSVAVLAFDGDLVVGASTGLPLADESEAFTQAFAQTSINPAEVFYCGESVLLPQYRGRGIGHRFFDEREAHARSYGDYAWTAFCAVDREPTHPRRPAFQRGNDAFWNKRGYRARPELRARLPWREVGQAGEVDHTLTFWLRPLERTR